MVFMGCVLAKRTCAPLGARRGNTSDDERRTQMAAISFTSLAVGGFMCLCICVDVVRFIDICVYLCICVYVSMSSDIYIYIYIERETVL